VGNVITVQEKKEEINPFVRFRAPEEKTARIAGRQHCIIPGNQADKTWVAAEKNKNSQR